MAKRHAMRRGASAVESLMIGSLMLAGIVLYVPQFGDAVNGAIQNQAKTVGTHRARPGVKSVLVQQAGGKRQTWTADPTLAANSGVYERSEVKDGNFDVGITNAQLATAGVRGRIKDLGEYNQEYTGNSGHNSHKTLADPGSINMPKGQLFKN